MIPLTNHAFDCITPRECIGICSNSLATHPFCLHTSAGEKYKCPEFFHKIQSCTPSVLKDLVTARLQVSCVSGATSWRLIWFEPPGSLNLSLISAIVTAPYPKPITICVHPLDCEPHFILKPLLNKSLGPFLCPDSPDSTAHLTDLHMTQTLSTSNTSIPQTQHIIPKGPLHCA
jgi:hypothetical protein